MARRLQSRVHPTAGRDSPTQTGDREACKICSHPSSVVVATRGARISVTDSSSSINWAQLRHKEELIIARSSVAQLAQQSSADALRAALVGEQPAHLFIDLSRRRRRQMSPAFGSLHSFGYPIDDYRLPLEGSNRSQMKFVAKSLSARVSVGCVRQLHARRTLDHHHRHHL